MSRAKKMLAAILLLGIGLFFDGQAATGVQGVLESQGLTEFGQAVKASAQQILSTDADPADKIGDLVLLLNEVAEIGDEDAARYAVVAVMAAGAPDQMDLAEAAVRGSELYVANRPVVETVLADLKNLLGGGLGGGDEHGGGLTDEEMLGGGAPILFFDQIDFRDDNQSAIAPPVRRPRPPRPRPERPATPI